MFGNRSGLKFALMLLVSSGLGGCMPDSPELARQQASAPALHALQSVDGAADKAELQPGVRPLSESPIHVKLSVGQPDCQEATGSQKAKESTGSSAPIAKYWIGIQSQPAPKALLDQLDLNCGLLVNRVIEGGPSTGLLRESDVITHFNGQELNCQKKLCGMIVASGMVPIKLTVIRKRQVMELEVQPQPVEVLADGQILQYTVLADEVDADPTMGIPELSTPGFEKLRLFVVQPMLKVGGPGASPGASPGATGAIGAEKKHGAEHEAEHRAEQGAGQWQMVRVASFRFDEDGRRILVVQEGGQVKEYTEDQIDKACDGIKKLIDWIDNGP